MVVVDHHSLVVDHDTVVVDNLISHRSDGQGWRNHICQPETLTVAQQGTPLGWPSTTDPLMSTTDPLTSTNDACSSTTDRFPPHISFGPRHFKARSHHDRYITELSQSITDCPARHGVPYVLTSTIPTRSRRLAIFERFALVCQARQGFSRAPDRLVSSTD
ncbi:hypothetical protein BDZ89DRAFT_150161 [Hymenopellis radicata]|nr:hypothetical protein BDZ89DRAFT_561912 [Hymenopellis radicata]KAF9023765.1 hypothetical protein BDZ89DRAFT_150161 [Hymenopellis radicata]